MPANTVPANTSGTAFTQVYTDGACSGNPGPGGWAWVIADGPHGSGAEAHTTNQRMEIKAVLEALRSNEGSLHIISDSTYVVNCFRDRWHEGWLKRGWKNSQRKPVANRDLWEPLIELAVPRIDEGTLRFSWVKGHSGDPMNDLADKLAVAARDEVRSLDGAGQVRTEDAEPGESGGPAVPWDVGPTLLVVGTVTPDRDQRAAIAQSVKSLDRGSVVVSGLRRGSELLAAELALENRLQLAAVLPFADPAMNWDEELRSRFDEVYSRASYDIVLDGDPSAPGLAVRNRNRWYQNAALGALVVGDDDLADSYEAAGLTVVRA
ncbi:MAG: RNase H family protein [Acidimicrobiales bacterium]